MFFSRYTGGLNSFSVLGVHDLGNLPFSDPRSKKTTYQQIMEEAAIKQKATKEERERKEAAKGRQER